MARFWTHAGKAIELEMTADSRVSAAVRSPHAKWVTHGLSMAHQMMSGRNESEASRFKRNTRSYERRDRLLRSTISEEYAKLERGYSDRRAREEVVKSLTAWKASFHSKRDALAKMLDPRRVNMATFKGCLDSLLDTASVCSCQPLKKGKEPSPFLSVLVVRP